MDPEQAARPPLARGRELLAPNYLPLVLVGVTGTWLGVHALRAYFTMVVWNVAEDTPATQMGLVALAVWVLGLLGGVAGRAIGRRRAFWVFGLLLAVLTTARQALPGEFSSPILAFAAAIVWLWWLPAYVIELARRHMAGLAAPALVAGLIAQVAGQTALNGLDVHVLTGAGGAVAGGLLAGTFVAGLWWARESARLADDAYEQPAWGAAAVGPYVFVQLTLLSNLGRLQVTSGWELLPVSAVALLALLAGLAALRWLTHSRLRLALAAVAVLLLAPGEWMTGGLLLAVIPIQVGLSLALAAAFAMPNKRFGVHAGFVVGALVFFVLFFVYYSGRDALTLLWPIAALLVCLPMIRGGSAAVTPTPQPLVAAAVVAVVGLLLSLIPSQPSTGRATSAAPTQLNIFNYNIHQALDYYSVPSPHAVADVIQGADADLVTLQEINRGWNISGGVDMAAWLRWRFPSYYVIYGPMQTQLFGNVIMSKYPVSQTGWDRFPRGQSTNTRGYVWAIIPSSAGEIVLATAHLTPYAGFDQDRADQAIVLQQFWSSRARTIFAGDFNATPDDAAIERLLRGGLKDVHAILGKPDVPTYSSGRPHERIDYMFVSPDVTPIAADVPRTLASDHLPLSATVRLGP